MADLRSITVGPNKEYSNHLATELVNLRTDDILTDFTIHSGVKSISCHRVLLAACSPVLKKLVTSPFKEGSEQEVRFDHISIATIEAILQYIYSGEATVPTDQMISLVEACDFLQILNLQHMCLDHVPSIIDASNVISWLNVAQKFKIDKVEKLCRERIISSFADVAKTQEFAELSLDRIVDCVVFAHEGGIDSDLILDAAMRWTDYDSVCRSPGLEELLDKVKLGNCSYETIQEKIALYSKLLDSQPNAYKLFFHSLPPKCNQCKNTEDHKLSTEKASNPEKIVIISGSQVLWSKWQEELPDFDSLLCLDLQKQEIQKLDVIEGDYCRPWNSVCRTDDGIAVTGGDKSNVCAEYFSALKSWLNLQPMLIKRHSHGSIFYKGVLMVFGGYINAKRSSRVDSMNMQLGKWQHERPLPLPVDRPKVASIDTAIYVLDEDTNSLMCRKDGSEFWFLLTAMPGKKCIGASMIAAQGKLFVVGGHDEPVFARYTAATDTWCRGNPPHYRHYHGALCYYNQKLYIIGGTGSEIEEYSLTDGDEDLTWKICDAEIGHMRYNHHAFTLNFTD